MVLYPRILLVEYSKKMDPYFYGLMYFFFNFKTRTESSENFYVRATPLSFPFLDVNNKIEEMKK